jgi:hypothetical protein
MKIKDDKLMMEFYQRKFVRRGIVENKLVVAVDHFSVTRFWIPFPTELIKLEFLLVLCHH